MSSVPSDAEPKSWHRYFAVQFNNRAWDLAERISRTREETKEMLEAAHAAAVHWRAIGTPLNQMRAQTLLAQAYALAGFGAFALQLSDEIRTYFLSRESASWELALVHAIHANAAARAGEMEVHRSSYAAAEAALAGVTDAEEREIVEQTLRQVPVP